MRTFLPLVLLLAITLCSITATAQPGSLWGMTATNGTTNGVIFKTDSTGGSYTEVYTFNNSADGIDPYGSLLATGGSLLWGMTSRGGANNHGVIFSFDTDNNVYTKLYDFDSVNGKTPYGSLARSIKGTLYGMTFSGGATSLGPTRGVLFEFNQDALIFTKKIDFALKHMGNAYGSLIDDGTGRFWGLTSVGGADATGALFTYDPQLDSLQLIESFIAGPAWEGYEPMGDLVQAIGGFYGLSRHGGAGAAGGGVLFRYDPGGTLFNKMKALHRFSEDLPGSVDGFDLVGSLGQANNGKLYGMTRSGGTDSAGTIFSFDIATNTFAKVHDFDSTTEGFAPHGSLMQSYGKLYGLISSPGGQARLFQFDPANNTVAIKANVSGTPYYTKLVQLYFMSAVHDAAQSHAITVYPNPASDKLHIRTDSQYTNLHLQLTGIDGRIGLNQNVNSDDTIDTRTLATGVYLLRVSSGSEVLYNTTIVIQR